MSENEAQSFAAILQKEGNFTFVTIPFSPREVWGTKPRYYVTGTINGIAIRGTLGASGQDYFLRLGAAWLRDSGIQPGATLRVNLSLEGPQENNLAPDIVTALSNSPTAKAFFDRLPTYYRKNYIRWIESAKREATRAKRIDDMVKLLEEERRER